MPTTGLPRQGLSGRITAPLALSAAGPAAAALLLAFLPASPQLYAGTALGAGAALLALLPPLALLRRRRAAATAAADRLQLVFETAAEGIFGVDTERRVILANPAAARILGWDSGAAMLGGDGTLVLGHHLADGKPCHSGHCAVRATMKDGQTRRISGEFFQGRSGKPCPVDYTVSPLRGDDGRVEGAVLVFHDTSEQKRAAREIRALTRSRQAMLDNAPIGMALIGLDRVVLEANQTFAAVFGRAGEDLRGMHARHLYSQEAYFNDVGERAYPVLRAGDTFRGDIRMARRDGAEIWVRLVSHIVDSARPDLGVVWTAEDITERKALELELQRSNEELERFAYVASHDLRQPLRMVSSYITLLRRALEGRLGEEETTFIGYATEGVRRMDRMITDLLDYSRIGRQNTAKEMVRLDDILRHAQNTLEAAIAEAGAALECPETGIVLPGYPSELERLLQNLVANAIKFRTPDRPPRVRIACRDDGREWILSVADNGIGIAPEYHHRLFMVFQRLVSREQYEGTGIGLAACRKIAEHHGGRIWLESEAGQGCTIFVALPKQ